MTGVQTCALPISQSLPETVIQEIRRQATLLAEGLKVVGLMNIQFAVKDGAVFILEVNPRASRTVPFVAKATGVPIAKIASRIMAGEKLADFPLPTKMPDHVAVKEAVFPFNRFPGVDVILGPEMKSTGEVMGIDQSFPIAFAKSQLGANTRLPDSGTIFISVKETDKKVIEPAARLAEKLGFKLIATSGTAAYLAERGITVEKVNKVAEGRPHIVDRIKDGDINLIFNTTEGWQSTKDSKSIRAAALVGKITQTSTQLDVGRAA